MKKLKRLSALLAALLMITAAALPITARESCEAAEHARSGRIYDGRVSIVIDGESYGGDVYTVANTAYVSLREFSDYVGASVSWDQSSSTAQVSAPSLSLSVEADSNVISANGRALWCEFGSFLYGGRLYVPVRQISRAFGFDCDYTREDRTTRLTRSRTAIESGDSYYDSEELHWLSRIIEAEAGAEPFAGKMAVGGVIANRVRSREFPNSIVGVIFDCANGVQFSPVSNGAIYNSPSSDSILAAKLTLEGTSIVGDALYFLNASLADSFWIVNNCTYVMSIGGHDFYS